MISINLYYLLTISFFLKSILGDLYLNSSDYQWSIRPTDDFYTFVNGHLLNQTIIPPSESEWGGLYIMSHETLLKLKGILDRLTTNGTSEAPHPVDSVKRKLADFYLSGLDQQTIEEVGILPLKQTLIQLQNVNTYEQLILFILNWYQKMDQGLIFQFNVQADEYNSSINMPIWRQTGIGLPNRDYYFRNDPSTKLIRFNYINYINHLLNLTNSILNVTTDLIDAEDVLSLETQLAASHRISQELRDPIKNYHKYTINHLDEIMPNLNWKRILNILTIKNATIILSQPDYYQLLDRLIVSQSLNIWKNKIRFHILHEMSLYLNKDFLDARFRMFEHLIFGQLEDKPRWMKILDVINRHVGELLGQLYVEDYFSNQEKQHVLNITNHVIDVYRQRINRSKWISDITKEKAVNKLNKMYRKIGYPSEWKSYQNVHIDRLSYFNSVSNIFQYSFNKKLIDLTKLSDRNEWICPPQTVNAAYYASFNEIIFPAAILQQPLYLFNADDAINYGGIGFLIAHELTHGFDDQGRKYDENGNLHLWWTEKDIEQFNIRSQIIIEQFNNYKLFDLNLNGYLSLGENIADLGGIEIAYEAFLQTKQAKDRILIDGFTPEQRFFLSFANAFRMKITDGKLRFLIKVDPHAPPIYRVNGPLSNMMGFYQAFNLTENDKMYRDPSKRVKIW